MDEAVAWLTAPFSGAAEHEITAAIAWHGRLMVLGWGILIPTGVIVARYFKIMPRQDWPRRLDNQFWWHWHRASQYAAMALAIGAALLAWQVARGATPLARAHGWLGWAVLAAGCAQVLSGWLRGSKGGPTGEGAARGDWRGDHYDMTRRRRLFEHAHKSLGLLTVAAATLAILLGLVAADAPRWMFALIIGWWLALIAFAAACQRQGRCIDTYQAIWGPDPVHPGNRMPPIGLGVRRRPDAPRGQDREPRS